MAECIPISSQPARNRIYGLTHDPCSRQPILTSVRTVKVGIGIPKGKDVHVWIDAGNKWCIQVGKGEPRRFEVAQAAEARRHYRETRKEAPERDYPRKVPYFTFTRPGLDGDFEHDLEMIALHGPLPTEIPIVFDQAEPLQIAYQWYSSHGLNCSGDGLTARRKVDLAETDEEKRLASQAAAAGLRTFPLATCALHGCIQANGEKRQCKPHGRLAFQLTKAMRMGGNAQYDTTGRRSISQLHSCIQRFLEVTGRGDPTHGCVIGIPMFLVVRPYRTRRRDGKLTVQYGVHLEYRGESVLQLRKELMGYAEEFRQIARIADQPEPPVLPAIEAPAIELPAEAYGELAGVEDEDSPDAAAMDAEFYGDFPDHDDDDYAETESAPMPQRKSKAAPPAEAHEAISAEVPPEVVAIWLRMTEPKAIAAEIQVLKNRLVSLLGSAGDVEYQRTLESFGVTDVKKLGESPEVARQCAHRLWRIIQTAMSLRGRQEPAPAPEGVISDGDSLF